MFDIRDAYFNWLCDRIRPAGPMEFENVYGNLLRWLNSRAFQFSTGLDYNRGVDGEELRYSFGRNLRIPQPEIASVLDVFPCSMLEMMVALDNRCVLIQYEYEAEHYGEIFWTMIHNTGLGNLTNQNFDAEEAERIVQRVENHGYAPNGEGGLFQLHNPRADLRRIDIWDQAMWYLSEISDLEV